MTEGVLFMYDSMIDRNQSWKQGIVSLLKMLKKRGIPFLVLTRMQEKQHLIKDQILEEANCYPVYYKDDHSLQKAAETLDLDLDQCIVVSCCDELRKHVACHIPAIGKTGYELMFDLMMQLI